MVSVNIVDGNAISLIVLSIENILNGLSLLDLYVHFDHLVHLVVNLDGVTHFVYIYLCRLL